MPHRNQPTANLAIKYQQLSSLIPDPKNARKHTAKQIARLSRIIDELGWSVPIVIDERKMIIAGHARVLAARSLGMEEVPCVQLTHLSAAEKTALAIADNAMTDASSFDEKILRDVLIELTDLQFDVELTGLEMGIIDFTIDGAPTDAPADPADTVQAPAFEESAVSRQGDVWATGEHKLLCGNSLEADSYVNLLGEDRAAMIFTDVPFNVRIPGNVSGLGQNRHGNFQMASGEMSDDQYRIFLTNVMGHLCKFSKDGSIHYHFIDWRHYRTMLDAGQSIYTEVKNLCVWNKSNAGLGSLYRSKHELIVVFKNGTAPHINHIALGKNGRNRTNVWDYAGANAFGKTRDSDLAAHPTVKPIALVADAMRDCSNRGDIILDPFMGSGTTIMAAERSGRRAMGIEIDPHYCDTAIQRWQKATGKSAVLVSDGRTFAEVALDRASPSSASEGDK